MAGARRGRGIGEIRRVLERKGSLFLLPAPATQVSNISEDQS